MHIEEGWMCNACRRVYDTEAEAAGCPCPMHTHARTKIVASSNLFPTLRAAERAHGKCPRPITEDGSHWWYNDWEVIERRTSRGNILQRWPCKCKTCGLKVEVNPNAVDLPEV